PRACCGNSETNSGNLPRTMATRIAICKSTLAGPVSGADETLVTYATNLRAAGQDVTVVLLYPPAARDPHQERLRRAGVEVVCVAENSLVYALLGAARDLFVSLLFFL